MVDWSDNLMEIIVIILAAALILMFMPYINFIIQILNGIVPSTIMTFLLLGISLKIILFVIHRGGEG